MEPLKDHICVIAGCPNKAFGKFTVCEEHFAPKKEVVPS
jgi:hypothetical protein